MQNQYELAAEHIINELKKYVDERLATLPAAKDGADGKDGAQGPAGADGKSVDMDALKAMVDDAVKALPPAKDGADGKDGQPVDMDAVKAMVEEAVKAIPSPKDGKDGAQGPAGADGKSIDMDALALMVKSEIMAIEIPQPKNGKDGIDGKDAPQIEILDGIDETKSYARGTYATHKGGLWKSFEKTKAMRGWECIVNGIQSHEVTQHEERNFKVKTVYSNGEEREEAFTIPAAIYRDVFRQGTAYAKGDMVTWAGNIYHCNEDTEEKPGEGSKSWTLAVKRGRDGRDKL